MSALTPGSALGGGLLIGLSAVLWMGFAGRIAGISGMAAGLWPPATTAERAWRCAFLAGLIAGTGIWVFVWGPAPAARPSFPTWLLVLSGLLVGFGTSMSHGCTSGHGVCGIARLSRRSFAATGTFLGVAMLTTYLVRHVLRWA